MSKSLIFAHRGFSSLYPENTLLAFEKAAAAGADGIEFDVHMAADGIPVVVHDPILGRTVKGSGFVQNFRSEQLGAMDAGTWKNGSFTGVGVPTLRQVFEWAKTNSIQMNVEIKSGIQAYQGLEKAVADLIKEFGFHNRVMVSAFDHYVLTRMRDIDPKVETGALIAGTLYKTWDYLALIGAKGLHFNVYCPIPMEDMAELKKRGIKLRAWTVNEPEILQLCLNFEMDVIISDYPDLALKMRG